MLIQSMPTLYSSSYSGVSDRLNEAFKGELDHQKETRDNIFSLYGNDKKYLNNKQDTKTGEIIDFTKYRAKKILK